MEYGLAGIMQPTVSFEKGFCNFDCTVCGDVCPNGAILPISVEQKHLTQMDMLFLSRKIASFILMEPVAERAPSTVLHRLWQWYHIKTD